MEENADNLLDLMLTREPVSLNMNFLLTEIAQRYNLSLKLCRDKLFHWNCTKTGFVEGGGGGHLPTGRPAGDRMCRWFPCNDIPMERPVSPIELGLMHLERQTHVSYFLVQRRDNIMSYLKNFLGGSSPHLLHREGKDEPNHCDTLLLYNIQFPSSLSLSST